MASNLTKVVANFETQLAAKLAVGATTGSLSGVTDKNGVTIPTGKYCMVADLGTSSEEHLTFDLDSSTKAMTNIKTVSRQGVETAGVAIEHRVGAKVKITDFKNLKLIVDILNGTASLDGSSPLKFDAEPTDHTDRKQVADVGYVNDTLAGSVGTATDVAAGTVKTTHNQGSKPRAMSTLTREQNSPDMTLSVGAFKLAFLNQDMSFAGGNAPAHINPGLGGDIEMPTNNPANGETITINVNGTACVVTFVTSIGATPGNVLIGGNVAATRANLAAFLNAPGTTNANQVAFTGAQLTAIQKLSATDDLSAKIFLRVIDSTVTTFSVSETMAGAGNVWTVNTTKHRIDLVVFETGSGTLKLRKGSEAVSPTAPTPTSGDVVLAQVFCRVGMTSVKDRDDSTNGYIVAWYFPTVYRTDLADTTTVANVNAKYETKTAGEQLVLGDPVFIAPNGLKSIRRVVQGFENATSIQNAYTLGSNNSNMIGQSFNTGGFRQLTGAACRVRSWNSNNLLGMTFNVELYATSAGVPTGSALATGSYVMGGSYGMKQALYLNGNRSEALINIPFSAPVAVSPNTQYAVLFYISSGNSNDVSFYYNSNNDFSSGTMVRRSGGTFSIPDASRDVFFYVFNDISAPNAGQAYLATGYGYGSMNNYASDVTPTFEVSPANNFAGIAMSSVAQGASVNIQIGGVGTIAAQTLNDTVTETLDQAQTSVGSQIINWDSSNKYYAQSFITGDNVGNITKIDLNLGKVGAPGGTLYFGLYEVGADGGPTGDPLATWQVTNATINAGTTWYTFTFGTPVKVFPRHKYIIHGIYDSYIATNYFFWMGNSTGGTYNHGEYWANTNTATLGGGAAGFRTYYTQRIFADIGDKAYLGGGKIELNEVAMASKAIGTIKDTTLLDVNKVAKDELVAIYGINISNTTGNFFVAPIRRNVRRVRCIMYLDNTNDGAIPHEIAVPELINTAPGLTFSNMPIQLDSLPSQNSRYAVRFNFSTPFPSGSRVYFYEYK